MKKLELKLDALEVDTFHTDRANGPNGTIFAYVTMYHECGSNTDEAQCWASTYGGPTCDTTCFARLCNCSQYDTDCDQTCPNYDQAEFMSCFENC